MTSADVTILFIEPENVKLLFTLQCSEDAQKRNCHLNHHWGQSSCKHITSQVQEKVNMLQWEPPLVQSVTCSTTK